MNLDDSGTGIAGLLIFAMPFLWWALWNEYRSNDDDEEGGDIEDEDYDPYM